MLSNRSFTTLTALFLLILAMLACALPQQGASTPSITQLIPTNSQATPPTHPPQTPIKITSPTLTPTIPQAQISHWIATHRIYGLAKFYDTLTGKDFTARGVNYSILVPVLDHYEDRLFGVGVYDHARTQADFDILAKAGYNTVRIILDGCSSGDGCIGIEGGQGLNQAYLDNIADLMSLAKDAHLFLLMAVGDLPALGGYAEQGDRGASGYIAAGRNAHYLTSSGIQAAQVYWSDLLTGLIERQAPFEIVLGWELQGDQYYQSDHPPFSLTSGKVKTANGETYNLSNAAQKQLMAGEGLQYYIDQLHQTILTYDPTALVSMGFPAPNTPNTWREDDERYVSLNGLLDDSALDFFDFHAYPGDGLNIQQLAQNFTLSGHISKPVLMGEVGAHTWSYPEVANAAIAVQDWIAASCAIGFSGWIYEGYYPSPAGLAEATWGFVDEHNYILNAISPNNQPNACFTTILPGRNLALGKTVSVSAALPDQTPQMAVDGDPSTQWSAGAFATQWIEVDLGSATTIGEIRLTVGQWPAGNTVHQLWVGASQDAMRMVQEFSGYEIDFDVLNYIPATSLTNIRYIRIVTTESPSWISWREIEAFAPFPGTATPAPEHIFTPAP